MLEEMKTFIAVVENKNFTKAAEIIKLSQPSVSLHIKHLEEHFNTTLIQRSIKQKNIIITKAGKLLYKRAKQIIQILENTKSEILDYSSEIQGELRIGASFTIGEYFLPAFLGYISKEYPNLNFKVSIENTLNICKKVENLELDLGLIEGGFLENKFYYESIYKDRMVLAVPYKSKVYYKDILENRGENQVWISREMGSGTREYLDNFFIKNNILPKNLIEFGSNYAVKEAVKNNLGITLISEYIAKIAEKNEEIKILDMEKEYRRFFTYILPKNIIISNATKAFIEKIKKYFNEITI